MVRLKKARGILYVFIAMFVLGVALVPICYGQGETKEAEQPAAAPAAAPAEEPAAEAPCGPTVNINTTLFSKYVWRGYELSKDSFVIFPQVTVSYKGLSIRWWGDIDTNYGGDVSGIEPDGLQCWEQDYIAYYSNSYVVPYAPGDNTGTSRDASWNPLYVTTTENDTIIYTFFWRERRYISRCFRSDHPTAPG